jgi:single-strand DNA-binding protein
MSLNKVLIIGNCGKDPEVRMAGEAKVATINVATTERYKDRNGETRENTEWHTVVAWRNTADVVERFVRKGTQLYVEGKLRTRSWDDNGQKRYVTEIMADNIQLLGKKENTSSAPATPKPTYSTTPIVEGVAEPQDDDLPF